MRRDFAKAARRSGRNSLEALEAMSILGASLSAEGGPEAAGEAESLLRESDREIGRLAGPGSREALDARYRLYRHLMGDSGPCRIAHRPRSLAPPAAALEEAMRLTVETGKIVWNHDNQSRYLLAALDAARIMSDLGMLQAARKLRLETKPDRWEHLMPGDFRIIDGLGESALDFGNLADAEKFFDVALDCRRRVFGNRLRETLPSAARFADVKEMRGEPLAAMALRAETAAALKDANGPGDRDAAALTLLLARTFLKFNDPGPAVILLERLEPDPLPWPVRSDPLADEAARLLDRARRVKGA
jgi:hypothetical protein